MGYILTERGEQEFDTYSDADEDELRLTRRSLMVPVLKEIKFNPNITFIRLLEGVGEERSLSKEGLVGIIMNLTKKGFIERVEPLPSDPESERVFWRARLGEKERGEVPYEDREERDYSECNRRARERYPELTSFSSSESVLKWQAEHPEEHASREPKYQKTYREAHREELRARGKERYYSDVEDTRRKNREKGELYRERKLEKGFIKKNGRWVKPEEEIGA